MPGIIKQKGLTALTRTVQVENPSSSVMLLAENDDSQIEKIGEISQCVTENI